MGCKAEQFETLLRAAAGVDLGVLNDLRASTDTRARSPSCFLYRSIPMTLELDSFESDANIEHFCLVGPGDVGVAVSSSPSRLVQDKTGPASSPRTFQRRCRAKTHARQVAAARTSGG